MLPDRLGSLEDHHRRSRLLSQWKVPTPPLILLEAALRNIAHYVSIPPPKIFAVPTLYHYFVLFFLLI
ncbi:hypothetical protein CR201_G0027214 [Pongo abelii]|uniref:Uncharacterized protein n=1 Tax=Pongo abelii TaxID=9601 RepID=A0A2J8UKL5_PONAB|nr:hypothetical protein CR201_G0027214 [Pongo abelii]